MQDEVLWGCLLGGMALGHFMHKLRCRWRLAFAFDPTRNAILLVAGDKSGGSARRFYRTLLRKAAERFDRHLARFAGGTGP